MTTARTLIGLGIGLSPMLGSGAAWAQSTLAATPAPAVSATRTTEISPQVRYVYDSNILRVSKARPVLAGRHRADYRVTPQLEVSINQPLGRQQLFVEGLVGYDFYRYNDQLERERINLTGGARLSAGRCLATPQVSYVRQQSDLGDVNVLAGGLKNTEELWTSSASLQCRGAGGISSNLGYSHTDVENSDVRRSLGDYHSDDFSAGIGLSRPALGDISLYSRYRRSVYDLRVLPGLTGNETIKSYSSGISLERQFGRIRGVISAGYSRVESNRSGTDDFSGADYAVDLTYRAGRITARVGAARSIQASNLIGASYGVNDNYSAGVTYNLGPRLDLFGDFQYSRRRFNGTRNIGILPGLDEDKFTVYRGGANYRLGRHIGIVASAERRIRRADLSLFDYRSTILALTLRFF